MKIVVISVCAFLLFGCADMENKAKKDEAVSEVVVKENSRNFEADFYAEKVASLNFEALERKYFQKNTDSIYVINFWATWCKPCVKELPAFEKIGSEYSNKKVKVVLVSLDFPDKIEEQVIPFIKKNNIESEVVLLDDPDANSWIPKVSPEWSGAIPATVIYKRDKRKFYEQSFTFKQLETELNALL